MFKEEINTLNICSAIHTARVMLFLLVRATSESQTVVKLKRREHHDTYKAHGRRPTAGTRLAPLYTG